MTIVNPEPANTGTVEPKVKWTGIVTYLVGVVVLALINAFTDNDNQLLLESLPDIVEPFILPIIPVVSGVVAGYFAKHQWRTPPGARGGATGSTPIG
jgi:hypothetical protein